MSSLPPSGQKSAAAAAVASAAASASVAAAANSTGLGGPATPIATANSLSTPSRTGLGGPAVAAIVGSAFRPAGRVGSGGPTVTTAAVVADTRIHPVGQNSDGGLATVNMLPVGVVANGGVVGSGNGGQQSDPIIFENLVAQMVHFGGQSKADLRKAEKRNEKLAEMVVNLETKLMAEQTARHTVVNEKEDKIQKLQKTAEDNANTINTLTNDVNVREQQLLKDQASYQLKQKEGEEEYAKKLKRQEDCYNNKMQKMKDEKKTVMDELECMKKNAEAAAIEKKTLETKLADSERQAGALSTERSRWVEVGTMLFEGKLKLDETLLATLRSSANRATVQDTQLAAHPIPAHRPTEVGGQQAQKREVEPVQTAGGTATVGHAITEPSIVPQENQVQETPAKKRARGSAESGARSSKKPKTRNNQNH